MYRCVEGHAEPSVAWGAGQLRVLIRFAPRGAGHDPPCSWPQGCL